MGYDTNEITPERAEQDAGPMALDAPPRFGDALRGIKRRIETAPLHVHFVAYLFLGGVCGIANLVIFLAVTLVLPVVVAALIAFMLAAILNYYLCLLFLFRHRVHWSQSKEWVGYAAVVCLAAAVDSSSTVLLVRTSLAAWAAKATASFIALAVNYIGRRYFVFRHTAGAD